MVAHAEPAGVAVVADPSEAAELLGHKLAGEKKWLEAAKAMTDALKAVPNDAAHRGRRNQLASVAVAAYRLAFEAAPADCAPLIAGLALADEHLAELGATYGAAAAEADDDDSMKDLRSELEQTRVAHQCSAPSPTETQPEPPTGGSADVPEEPPQAAPPMTSVKPSPKTSPRTSRVRPLAIGVGVSAGLAVGMAIGTGILYSQLKKPGGWRWDAIRDAAEANDLYTGDGSKMCLDGANIAAVSTACDDWYAAKRGFIATAVLAGVFAASSAVFTGLLIREQRRHRPVAQAWQRHQVHISAAPRIAGVTLTAGFRF